MEGKTSEFPGGTAAYSSAVPGKRTGHFRLVTGMRAHEVAVPVRRLMPADVVNYIRSGTLRSAHHSRSEETLIFKKTLSGTLRV